MDISVSGPMQKQFGVDIHSQPSASFGVSTRRSKAQNARLSHLPGLLASRAIQPVNRAAFVLQAK